MGLSRRMTTEEVAAAISQAVAQATTAATFTAHMVECKEDKQEIKNTLARQDLDRARMHDENSAKFTAMDKRLNDIGWYIALRLIVALVVTLGATVGTLYAIFAHKVGIQ